MADDIFFMDRAIELAKKADGLTSPNPIVGCVLVKAGRVIAEGWHKRCGADHAEIVALKKAGAKARGAVMYVTLEPCSHWGRTPPCVNALITSGVKKVVVAMRDPDPRTNGKSLKAMRAHGIQVVVGVREDEAREMNSAFIKYVTTGMPFVVAKSAQTIDGKVAVKSGDSKWITSEETRTFSRDKRNGFDAILVGVNTVLSDDPCLCAPGKMIRKIIVDSTLRMSPKAKAFKGAKPGQVLIATTKKASLAKMKRLEGAGADVVVCSLKEGRVDLQELFKALAKNGMTRILIEGGPSVISSALKAGVVDRMHIYIAPKVMGDDKAKSSVSGFSQKRIADLLEGRFLSAGRVGRDIFIELEV